MENRISVSLSQETLNELKNKCGDDPQAMQDFIHQAIREKLASAKDPEQPSEEGETKGGKQELEEGLEAYLKSAKPGSRAYGIKGQGW